jgi:hypothetical protein
MASLPELHDGFFDGVWLSSDKVARIFVRTQAGERFTIILSGIEALHITSIKAGNIIFEVAVVAPDKLSLKYIEDAYALRGGQEEMSHRLLTRAQEQRLSGLEINSSYGAEGAVLFGAVDTVREHVLA